MTARRAASGLALFDLDLQDCDKSRRLLIFTDGVYQEAKQLPAGLRLVAGLHATIGALVRLELQDHEGRRMGVVNFEAHADQRTFSNQGITVRLLGDLFSGSSLPSEVIQ